MMRFNQNENSIKHLFGCFLCFVLIVISIDVTAQIPDSIELKSVIVSTEKASGIPALKSVNLDSAILRMSESTNIGSILTKHSSITIKDYGPSGIQTPTFRGMSASHTKIYLNGLDISPGSLGQSDLSILPSFLFDEVSLKFGNSAFTEGPGAIGGGVLLQSKTSLSTEGSSAIAGITIGSFGSYGARFQYGYRTKKFQSITRYIYQKAKNNFEYRNIAQPESPTVTQEHAEKFLHGVSQSFKYVLNNKNQLTAMVLGSFSDRNLPALMTDTKSSTQNQNDKMLNMQLGWNHYGKNSKSNLVAGYSWSSLNYVDNQANINSTTINQRFQVREDYTLNINTKWALLSTAILDYSTAQNPSLSGNQDMLQSSVLIGFNGHLSKKWEVGAFIQPTINRNDFELLPMASIAFLPTGKRSFVIGGNVAQNVHFPTLNDLYWTPGGNPNLEPESAMNGELSLHLDGIVKQELKWEFDVSGFYGNVDNWILWQPSDKAYWEAQNIKSVEHSGAETSLGLRRKLGNINLNFKGSYQFVNAINKGVEDESLNKQLIYTPKHSANWLLGVSHQNFWINTNYTFTGIRYITTSNSSYLPNYDLVNIVFGYNLKLSNGNKLDFQFDVNNVLNKEYMSVVYRAMPGINFQLNIRYCLSSK
jgi:iron complex outermembrane receptor protein